MFKQLTRFGAGILPALAFTALVGATSANAATLGFTCVEGGALCEAVDQQFSLLVTAGAGNTVNFALSNLGPAPSSIAEVYFNTNVFSGFTSGPSGAGTSFTTAAVAPPALPGNGSFQYFGMDAGSSAPTTGVNPGETLSWSMSLPGGVTNTNVVNSFVAGTYGVGIHVIAVDAIGQSGSITLITGTPGNPIPEPTTMSMLGIGLIGLGVLGRKRLQA